MTQNEKDLLLKDLCARLPYGVKVQSYDLDDDMETIETLREIDSDGYVSTIECDTLKHTLKPYLFPLSSMTEEQKEELDKYFDIDSKSLIDGYKNGLRCPHPYFNVQDWYNKNHFDYRGLIEKSLALDATNLGIYE